MRFIYLTAGDDQLQRRLADSRVLKSGDRHLHSDADSHAAVTMQPIRSTANARRSTIPHSSSHKSGHRACHSAIPYSERCVTGYQGYTAPSQRSFTPRPTRPSRHTTIIFRPSRLTSLLTHPVSLIPDRFRSHPTQQTIITRVTRTTSLFPIPNFHHRPNDLLNVAGHTPNTLIATFITLVTSAVLKTIGR